MDKKQTKKTKYQERILFGVASLLLLFVLVSIIYSFEFLSNNILPVVSPSQKNSQNDVHFNFKGFEELGL